MAATLILAWTKGGPGEREAAIAIAVTWIGSMAVETLAQSTGRVMALLFFDFALAAALLLIAIRHSSLWLGAAMLIQAFALAVHGQFLEETDAGLFQLYVIILNLASAALLWVIIGASVAAWIGRVRGRRASKPAADAAPAALATPA